MLLPYFLKNVVGSNVVISSDYGTLTVPVAGFYKTAGQFSGYGIVPFQFLKILTADREVTLDEILVSVVTVPDDEFARKDPKKMTRREYEKWVCTPYLSSIIHQIKEVLPNAEVTSIKEVQHKIEITYRKFIKFYIIAIVLIMLTATLALAGVSSLRGEERKKEVAI